MTKLANATIPVEQAKVEERSVTIKVLTVGTRQVTQALYKQLVEDDVMDWETGNLNGPVWGWVNLHVDCDAKGTHKHVVWECDGQLMRSCVGRCERQNDYYNDLENKLTDLAYVYVRLIAISGKWFNQTGDKIYLTIKGYKLSCDISLCIKNFLNYPSHIHSLKEDLDALQKSDGVDPKIIGKYVAMYSKESAIRQCEKLLESIPDEIERAKINIRNEIWLNSSRCFRKNLDYDETTGYEEIYQKMERVAEEMTAIKRNWDQSYQSILSAGQLFVAVSGVWK